MSSNNNIDIGPSAVDFLKEKKITLLAAIDRLKLEIANVDTAILALGGDVKLNGNGQPKPIEAAVNYDNLTTSETFEVWKNEIIKMFNREQRVLTRAEVIDILFAGNARHNKALRVKATNVLNYFSNKEGGEFSRHKTTNPEVHYYGLSEWFYSGHLKNEYRQKIK